MILNIPSVWMSCMFIAENVILPSVIIFGKILLYVFNLFLWNKLLKYHGKVLEDIVDFLYIAWRPLKTPPPCGYTRLRLVKCSTGLGQLISCLRAFLLMDVVNLVMNILISCWPQSVIGKEECFTHLQGISRIDWP